MIFLKGDSSALQGNISLKSAHIRRSVIYWVIARLHSKEFQGFKQYYFNHMTN